MNSSNDRLNENRAVAMIPGLIIGNTTRKKICRGFAPRSIAASSSARSNPCKRGKSVRKANGNTQLTCATSTVVQRDERTPENPKKISKTMPPIIPGIIIGTRIRYRTIDFPRKSWRNPIAKDNARIVAMVADRKPTPRLFRSESRSSGTRENHLIPADSKTAKRKPNYLRVIK